MGALQSSSVIATHAECMRPDERLAASALHHGECMYAGGRYSLWRGETSWALMPATVIAGQFLETFTLYPPGQPTGSTSADGPLQAWQAGGAGGGQ